MGKQKYYSVRKIGDTDSQYKLILSGRSDGKSYSVCCDAKHGVLVNAYKYGREFVWLRRFDLELATSIFDRYFADKPVEEITGGEYQGVMLSRGEIYFCTYNDKNKPVAGQKIGYARALTNFTHYKSGAYPKVEDIIYEEFISDSYYLPHEPTKLQNFVSTVLRRREGRVWLIGNTISRVCPYFREWQLTNIPKQKQGTIDIYKHRTDQVHDNGDPVIIKIAVEYPAPTGNNSKMFFGDNASAVTGGIWESASVPHLPKKLNKFDVMYKFFFEYENFIFLIRYIRDDEGRALYIEPFTKDVKPDARLITDRNISRFKVTRGFAPLVPQEREIFNLLTLGAVYYADNLTGADFKHCYDSFRKQLDYNGI